MDGPDETVDTIPTGVGKQDQRYKSITPYYHHGFLIHGLTIPTSSVLLGWRHILSCSAATTRFSPTWCLVSVQCARLGLL